VNQNPKHIQALKEGKTPLEHLVGGKVDAAEARVLAHGAGKYGVRNWRKDPILLKTYVGAIRRHLNAWADGEDLDPDSGESHLAHIRACCAVALDAMNQGTAQDDRLFMESKAPLVQDPLSRGGEPGYGMGVREVQPGETILLPYVGGGGGVDTPKRVRRDLPSWEASDVCNNESCPRCWRDA
jgi:hypothetical protein